MELISKRALAFLPFLLLFPTLLEAQGHLVLIGGGTEIDGGWSDDPYQWGVQHAPNQRVAVVTYDTSATQWIPNYFMNLGADTARNFIIDDAATADAQATYDSLMTYDAIFLKGGDQWVYISTYDNTRTEDAIRETYQQGGVVMGTSAGMAVLSEVDFTAQNGTVYPEEALADPYNTYMQLDSNFLSLMEGTIFDSHFVQRGRFGRMLGFMGRIEMEKGKRLLGIGVDDRTAFCIDTGDTGIAMGTGAVNLYKGIGSVGNFQISGQNGQKLTTDPWITVSQLLDSCLVQLEESSFDSSATWEPDSIQGLARPPQTNLRPEPSQREIFLSGSDQPAKNEGMVEDFLEKTWIDTVDDTVAVISANADLALADSMKQRLEQNGVHQAAIVRATPSMADDPTMTQKLEGAEGLFFVNSHYDSLMNTLGQGSMGMLLETRLDTEPYPKAFMGSDARLAGTTVIRYYDSTYASYNHELEFVEGTNVMEGCVIIPRCFDPNASLENAAAGVPFAMLKDSLPYGIQIPEGSHAHYTLVGWTLVLQGFGTYPIAVWRWNAFSNSDTATQALNSTGLPRQIAGFQEMSIALGDSAHPVGLKYLGAMDPNETDKNAKVVDLIRNPVQHHLPYRNRSKGTLRYRIQDIQGRLHQRGTLRPGQGRIDISSLSPGTYLMNYGSERGASGAQRFIKE